MSFEPSVLRRPQARDHLVQAYTDDAFLAKVVSDYIGSGLVQREGAVIIATPLHAEAFRACLASAAIDVQGAMDQHQLVFFDARRTMAQFMVDGAPDRSAFLAVIVGAFDRLRFDGYTKIRCFGEMVDLLWGDNLAATIRVEDLWNEVVTAQGVSLLCAYRFNPFDRTIQGVLHQVSRCHSRLLPAQDSEQFEEAVDRAYEDVFGTRADVDTLRRLIVSHQAATPPMPRGHAALLALRELPDVLARQVLERGRHYYAVRKRSGEPG